MYTSYIRDIIRDLTFVKIKYLEDVPEIRQGLDLQISNDQLHGLIIEICKKLIKNLSDKTKDIHIY